MTFAWTMALLASLQTPGSARPGMGSSFRPAESVRSVTALPVEDDAIEVDGDLSDPAWSEARPFPPLVQVVPRYGAPPTNPTDVRLAFDARGLYVAFDCAMAPEDIRAPFYVRDQQQPSDIVFIEIDPGDDDTNGFSFSVTASGAISDAQLSRDTERERLWDGVWRSATKVHEHGWSAEFFIPWSTLRFRKDERPKMAINVGRGLARGREWSRLNAPPQGVPGRVSFAVPVEGIDEVATPLNLEFRPFASVRGAIRRPEGSLDKTWAVLPNGGLDLKYGISGTLTLDVALNPDFGQAEVDAAFLNLGPFEVFLPEKRQFFLESRDIFNTKFSLFYSRRIGAPPRPGDAATATREIDGAEETGTLERLDPVTRIAAAARVTGEVAPGWILGAITATTAPTFGRVEFSDGTQDRVRATPTTQWSAARLRRQFDSQSYIGAIVTNVAPMRGDDHSLVAGVDYQVRFRERWTQGGQVIVTQRDKKTGMGAASDVAHSTPNTRLFASMKMLTPNADFNRLGYMQFADYTELSGGAHLFNAQPIGKTIRRLRAQVFGSGRVDFSGQVFQKLINTEWSLETLNLWKVQATFGGQFPRLDPYETRGNIPYEFPIHWWTGLDVSSPSDRRVVVNAGTSYGEQGGKPGPDARLSLSLRPVDRLRIDLGSELNFSFGRPRWVAEREVDAMPIFGTATTTRTSGDLRLTLGIRPRLSLSVWNRLFYATATHDRFFELTDPSTLVPTDPTPWSDAVDIGTTSFISNAIFRWEYLPGSFMFLTYTHRSILDERGAVTYSPSRMFSNLGGDGPSREDTVFLKVMHLFAL